MRHSVRTGTVQPDKRNAMNVNVASLGQQAGHAAQASNSEGELILLGHAHDCAAEKPEGWSG